MQSCPPPCVLTLKKPSVRQNKPPPEQQQPPPAKSRTLIKGESLASDRIPYEHQKEGRARLAELTTKGPFAGRLVFPTGAGKTDTAVAWLLDNGYAEDDFDDVFAADGESVVFGGKRRMYRLRTDKPAPKKGES